jgi:homoserine dehydrogenase
MKDIGVGLIGFGTVGAGVVDGFQRNGELLSKRVGACPVLRGVADLDLKTDRGVAVDRALLTTDAMSLIRSPDVHIVVELVGGTGIAKTFVLEALKAGKTVVTANKALLAEHGREIFGTAREAGVDMYFGASVGGGIPIIRALRDGLVANRIRSIFAILNGTCNYILTRMDRDGAAFADALARAQASGYAEADPTLDINGMDTAHKALILARLAYGLNVQKSGICVEGINGLAADDIAFARDLGYRIKLLAIMKEDGGEVEVRVHPALVPMDHMLASVSGVFNAVMVSGDLVGDTLYYGRGAGREATASTVLSDIADAARDLARGVARGWPVAGPSDDGMSLRPIGEIRTRYYLRVSLLDQPGALAQVAAILGEHGISIASAVQAEQRVGDYVPVVAVTHEAVEEQVRAALARIDALETVGAPTVRIRIEG